MNYLPLTTFKKILVVDDSPVSMAVNCALLKKISGASFEITQASSVFEALQLIEKQKFDFYLVDYLMENNRTGLEVLQKIRQKDAQVPVIILTGINEQGKDIELLQQGASDYLEKKSLSVYQLEKSLRFSWERKLFTEERFKYEIEKQNLLESIKGLEQVLGVVGHELRTPLAGVRAMAEYLREEQPEAPKEISSGLESIISETSRLAEVINNLLEVARLNSGHIQWNWGEVDFAEACKDALRSIYPLVNNSLVKLNIDLRADLPTFTGDQGAIVRLIHNLVMNSVKNTKEGAIKVGIQSDRQFVKISITDTGKGILPKSLKLLGEEFRLSAANSGASHIQGSGLGMSIVKGIAGAHGGTIKIFSELNRGTIVEVRLKSGLYAPLEGACQIEGSEHLYPFS